MAKDNGIAEAARIAKLTKREALDELETVPQRFWPPRPTRQSVDELRRCIARARITSGSAQ